MFAPETGTLSQQLLG